MVHERIPKVPSIPIIKPSQLAIASELLILHLWPIGHGVEVVHRILWLEGLGGKKWSWLVRSKLVIVDIVVDIVIDKELLIATTPSVWSKAWLIVNWSVIEPVAVVLIVYLWLLIIFGQIFILWNLLFQEPNVIICKRIALFELLYHQLGHCHLLWRHVRLLLRRSLRILAVLIVWIEIGLIFVVHIGIKVYLNIINIKFKNMLI